MQINLSIILVVEDSLLQTNLKEDYSINGKSVLLVFLVVLENSKFEILPVRNGRK